VTQPKLGYAALFQHVLTRIDAEKAHHLGFAGIRAARRATRMYPGPATRPVSAMGLTFPSALGLAAGFDKNAVGIDALAALGFGHVEVGTVTGEPQPGNPRPRLFRLPADQAIVNRMGFNNDGAQAVAARLAERARRRRQPVVLGVNIGKSKLVPEDDEAAVLADYTKSARLLSPYADYLVVNVSSPNTPGLRSLQAVDRLGPLLDAVRRVAEVPLLVKIAPDLADDDILDLARLALDLRLDGIIATNTTISRDGLRTPASEVEAAGAGGLSGAPLADRSLEVLRLLGKTVAGDLTLVSVGGISTVDDARARLEAGATLVQAYTGFVYGGPWWPRRIAAGL
jgi:dihydroorotate dehydrogenase